MTNNSGQNKETFTKEQEASIKKAFERYEDKRGIRQETPDYLNQSFRKKLDLTFAPKSAFHVKWKGFITALLAAFSIGFMVSRLALMPAVVATKGISDVDGTQSSPDMGLINRSIVVSNPDELVHKVIQAALDAGLEVESIKSNGKYALYIKPFRPKEKEQAMVKELIGVDSEAAGTVNLTISKKK
jgi:hypothetical protein